MSAGQQQQQEPKKKIKKGPNPRKPVYGSQIHKVMKQISFEASISSEAMLTVDAFVCDLERRLSDKAFKMAKYDQKSTLKAKHVKAAVNNMFRGDLLKVALSEGEKAINKFNTA